MLPVCQALTATALVQSPTALSWTLLSFHVALEEVHVNPLLGCNQHKRPHQVED